MKSIVLILTVCVLLPLPPGGGPLCSQTQDAKFRLAQTFEQAGDHERAAALYRELLQKDPANLLFADGLQRALVQLKRYDEAVQLLQQRIAMVPGDVNLRATLAGVYQRSGREQEARAEWEGILARGGANPTLYRVVASSMIEHRLLEQASDIYRRGRTACNDPALFTLELAQLRIAMMDYQGASRELVSWLLLNPAQIGFVQGRMAGFVTKPEGRQAAVSVVEEALANRRDVRLYELLSWLSLEGKEYERALELTRTIDELTRAQGVAVLQLADRVFRAGAFALAARAYREALNAPLPPRQVPAARYGYAGALMESALRGDSLRQPVGSAHLRTSESAARFQEALDAYQTVIREHPRTEFSAKAYYQIGILQFTRLFDCDAALASFDHVEEEAGAVRMIRYDVALKRGQVYLAKGDTARANREFASVARTAGATPDQQDEAEFRLAELAYFGGHAEEAVARLDSITVNLRADYANDALQLQSFLMENSPAADGLALFGQAELLARQRKNSEAVALLQKVVAQYPASSLVDDALLRIGELQAEAGFSAEALATYERLLTQFREGSIALDRAQFNIAETLQFDLRDREKAIAAYEKVLADYPQSVFSALARKRVRLLRGDQL
jgi:tetratricopeptide (TPR) repeat protein